ncbi:MAG: bifunctional [glutamate--ammonia ligase]-adenylyl-L-tyrosine phosphorylase/[glutamate--ammonia-ligase] adenylyltransferase [Deltaproteobacteria bacterium]|nr:MAG: bifunctional [glutamate--ammonia ligase]-adenylyl-L-tyrosine phosphorylase/[glutamate--ammonia-ligase] adenylyltransferase [Deltaproteobacteria bacterium]
MSSFLARHPVLLDELLDPRTLYRPESKEAVAREADRRLASVADGDLEDQVEQLCILRQTHTLRVAAADVTGALPIMHTSDYLTELAEVILEKVLGLAWAHLVERHGLPGGVNIADPSVPSGFAVIAYGKAGGLELGYGSDLDLVFVHTSSRGQSTDGPRPISNAQFFARIGERIVHILTAHTRAGRIYEVDMRLRPSGSAGPLVIEIEAFRDYQLQEAWTWEHQAIVRARPVAGDAALGERFAAIRAEVLQAPRDGERLREEVRRMRERMRSEHLAAEPGIFDLRQDRGGIVDIEFLVQYLVLLEGRRHRSLVRWTDNVRLLQTLIQTGILDEERAFMLREAYLIFRAKAHQLSLREEPARVPEARFAALRDRVRRVWQEIMETDQSR